MATAASRNNYQLVLVSLECVRKQDTLGQDEPKVLVNGSTIWVGNMDKGDTEELHKSTLFTSFATIDLREVDPGHDDTFTSVTARAQDVNKGEQTGTFHRAGADYKITYKVIPA